MKIHSKYKDYYDSALAYGVDTSKHWVRNVETKVVRVSPANYYKDNSLPIMHDFFNSDMFKKRPSTERSNTSDINKKLIYIGVCGKVYPAIHMSWTTSFNLKERTHTAFTADQVLKVLNEYDDYKETRGEYADNFTKGTQQTAYSWYDTIKWEYKKVDAYFNQFSGSEGFHNIFVEENVPIWVIDVTGDTDRNKGVLLTNPQLSQYDFQKIMDPYTMMQEIDMFLYGVLGGGNPDIIEPEDKYRITGHGFNECSFRKAPTKKKGKCSK